MDLGEGTHSPLENSAVIEEMIGLPNVWLFTKTRTVR